MWWRVWVATALDRRRFGGREEGYDGGDGSCAEDSIGDVVEVDGRKYEVVPDKAGGVTLEPAITKTVEELRAEHGGRPLTQEEFDELFRNLPSDGEG
jgi:hypothetical protein